MQALEDDLVETIHSANQTVRVFLQMGVVLWKDLLKHGELFFPDGLQDELSIGRVVEKAARLPGAGEFVERGEFSSQ